MNLLLLLIIAFPFVLLLNRWVYLRSWERKSRLFAAGLLAPALVALVEFLYVFSYR
ncbi:MAG: hypothetical protein HY043_03780 [Verrucomicrobia bacterium]|nr:hypothetical protein [Verrucomicrobiota bacterium]